MPDKGFWYWLASDPGKAALAGALGGLVRWITLRDSWKEGIPALALGAICAVYIGPVVEPFLEAPISGMAPEADITALAAFLTGIGGIGVAGFIMDVIASRFGRGRNGRS